MRRSGEIRLGALVTAVLLAIALGVSAHADVTIVQTSTSSGMGGFLDSETQTETMIKGDRQCVNTEMKSKLMGMFGGGSKPVQTTTITCIDKGVVWDVMHDSKSYTETPITRMRDMMGGYAGMGDEGDEQGLGNDDVKMSPPKFSVETTGKKETIAGYACEQRILHMEMEGEKVETGEKVKLFATVDVMLAKDVPGFEEQKAFNAKYAKAAGLDEMSESMFGALTEFGVDPDLVAEETGKLEGFPMRVTMTMRGEGDLMTPSRGEGEEPQDARTQEMLKKMGGLFGGGAEKAEGGETAATDALFSMTTEVTKISTGAISDDRFEPPAGYDKISDDSEGPE
ncbi:MAG TPA: hypothetical protein VM118_07310 [Acidobacteriota bacterium]|nr:hypothetical protein [Acidobacteriota bacterium]